MSYVIKLIKSHPEFRIRPDYWVGPLKENERPVEWSPDRRDAQHFTLEEATRRAKAMWPMAEALAVPA